MHSHEVRGHGYDDGIGGAGAAERNEVEVDPFCSSLKGRCCGFPVTSGILCRCRILRNWAFILKVLAFSSQKLVRENTKSKFWHVVIEWQGGCSFQTWLLVWLLSGRSCGCKVIFVWVKTGKNNSYKLDRANTSDEAGPHVWWAHLIRDERKK